MMKKKLVVTTLVVLFTCQFGTGQTGNPTARPEAVVLTENARFTVLTPGVVRLEWSENRKFIDHASLTFVNRNLPVPSFTVDDDNARVVIDTGSMKITYIKGRGPFSSENLSIRYTDSSLSFTWKPGMENRGNLLGTTRTLDGWDGDRRVGSENTESNPLEPGVLSKDGWVWIDDSRRPLFDHSEWPWVMPRPRENGRQDWYFFAYGHDYKTALNDFTKITGKIPIPPKFAFGIWWSRYWAYTDTEYRELVEEYKTHGIPLHVLVIDMDWHITDRPDWYLNGEKSREDQAGQTRGWTGFTWEKGYFPDHKAFLKWTDDQNLKTCLNLHPASGIQPHEEVYPVFARAMGIDPDTKKYIPFEIVDKNYANNYLDLVLHPMEKAGVDFWWLDWQQWGTTQIQGVNPTFYLNYVHFSDMQRQGKRPLIFHRWGGLGNHRYQIGFSGDTHITWKSLAYQPYFTSTASNVCFGYWSHDIGGHFSGDKQNPELFTRWIQWGALSPIFRTHCTKDPDIERRMWAYPPEYYDSMRDAVEFRIALFPYFYAAAHHAHETGISLIRPMYYDHPEEECAYSSPAQYMLGDDLLIAPVTAPREEDRLYVNRKIWLPEGEWIEMPTGTVMEGGRRVTRPYLLSETPVFVKAGAIIPMKPASARIDGIMDRLLLKVYPGRSGNAVIYDDEGNNDNYLNGKFSLTRITAQTRDHHTTLNIHPVEGAFDGMAENRSYDIHIVLTYPPDSVKIDGKAIPFSNRKTANTWRYDGQELSTIVHTDQIAAHKMTTVEINWPEKDIQILSGKPGCFDRIMFANKTIHSLRGFNYPQTQYFTHQAADLAQTGYRITLNPSGEDTEKALSAFDRKISEFHRALQAAAENNRKFKPLEEFIGEITKRD